MAARRRPPQAAFGESLRELLDGGRTVRQVYDELKKALDEVSASESPARPIRGGAARAALSLNCANSNRRISSQNTTSSPQS